MGGYIQLFRIYKRVTAKCKETDDSGQFAT